METMLGRATQAAANFSAETSTSKMESIAKAICKKAQTMIQTAQTNMRHDLAKMDKALRHEVEHLVDKQIDFQNHTDKIISVLEQRDLEIQKDLGDLRIALVNATT